ncbi:DUF3068 domain-containing protein [Nocardioides sp. W7]|uniref:DUF3068 domain-containing protein n=1 Tax=Nocardioides sp. W7 TaxID=2931390 RepID=UPI001FD10B5F|nr:DUF3068 domain-containing protein [Nocardioides sp. W7]
MFPPALVGLGVFLLVAAALIKFYAYPQLAVAPKDQDSITRLSAEDAVVFSTDPALLTEVKMDLEVTNTTRGDIKATNDAPDGTLVWADTQTVKNTDGDTLSQSVSLAAHDAHTGEAVDCCGSFVQEDAEAGPVEVVRKGQVYKFPFGTEQKSYQWWDDTILDTVEAKFEKETDLDGMTVYQFVAEIPQTVVGTREAPASIVGEVGNDPIEVDIAYANRRTFWVEPNTGVIIDRREEQNSTLQIAGEDRATTTQADLSYTDAQVAANIDEYEQKASLLGLVNGLIPLLALILGVLLIAGGVLLGRSRQSTSGTTTNAGRAPAKV